MIHLWLPLSRWSEQILHSFTHWWGKVNDISVVARGWVSVNINMTASVLTYKCVLMNASLSVITVLISMFSLTKHVVRVKSFVLNTAEVDIFFQICMFSCSLKKILHLNCAIYLFSFKCSCFFILSIIDIVFIFIDQFQTGQ